MKRYRLIAAASCALLLMAGRIAPPADATLPGRNGDITFSRPDANAQFQVWVARADMTKQRQLTGGDSTSGFSVWSPNGKRLAFDSNRSDRDFNDNIAINDIFVMNADGTGLVQVTPGDGFAADAAWAPSGRLLAYDSDRGDYPTEQGIYVSRTNGSGLRRVTTLPDGFELDLAPRFSPDGRWIVFTRYRLVDRAPGQPQLEESALFVVRPDGTMLRKITPFSILAGDADWSPDGRKIVFESNFDPFSNQPADVFTIRPDGSQLRNLTHNAGRVAGHLDFSSDPVFSPDGRFILFLDGHDTTTSFREGVATMRTNGAKRHFIATPKIEHQPDWQTVSTRRPGAPSTP